ncbi:MAG: LssY C-terminal domain-containing protein [Acidobacteria bacterium]|nr:LssY C-terminal domain-containing protein [Acidobacteriota bacterium]MBS1866035.1 LssY C-terminal domain-containing protein [Acidobacteriota bacterium]
MPKVSSFILRLLLAFVLPALWLGSVARAQLVGDPGTPPVATQMDSSKSQATAATPSGKKRLSKDFTLKGDSHWTDTNIDLQPGEHVMVTATGSMRYADAKEENGPEGVSRGFKDLLRQLPFNGAGRGAVIGRIGDPDTAETFLIGAQRDVLAPVAGRLAVGVNQGKNDSADGSYSVHVDVYAAETGAGVVPRVVAQLVTSLPGIDNALFEKIPRRIGDKEGNPGDMVNFLILGSETGMQRVFTTAGWVKVDADVKDTVLHGIIGSLSKESYLTMPMSQLYLFGRPQDYGWAHAEPISVVASRNHLRVWKAPFQVNGETVWVGAATHDIGFERDQRNNGITHKIDPNIDAERDYVGKTLSSTGLVAQVMHFLPDKPMQEAKTATGGSFHSNGQVLILKLAESGKDLSASFSSEFCSVLQGENPDGGNWGACGDYLNVPAADAPSGKVAEISDLELKKYRVLVVPGVLSSCQANTEAFQDGQKHLQEKHGITVDFFQAPNDTSTNNGAKIASYLREKMAGDARKYIVVSYSKGSPDVQEALASDPQARNAIAAHVTVAGAIGGSPIAETMPEIAQRYAGMLKLGTCDGNVADAFKSLRRDVRKRFLQDHPDPLVPSFSLAAVSDETTTSKMLLEAWKLLTAYDPRTDSQLLQSDALIPGGNYLGTLHADHLAVALNYENVAEQSIKAFANHNHYPRVALFEAAVRFAAENLASAQKSAQQ